MIGSPYGQLQIAISEALKTMTGSEIIRLTHWHVLACGTEVDAEQEMKWGWPT